MGRSGGGGGYGGAGALSTNGDGLAFGDLLVQLQGGSGGGGGKGWPGVGGAAPVYGGGGGAGGAAIELGSLRYLRLNHYANINVSGGYGGSAMTINIGASGGGGSGGGVLLHAVGVLAHDGYVLANGGHSGSGSTGGGGRIAIQARGI